MTTRDNLSLPLSSQPTDLAIAIAVTVQRLTTTVARITALDAATALCHRSTQPIITPVVRRLTRIS